MNKTRKVNRTQRAGGLFDFFSSSAPTVSAEETALKAKRNYNLKHSKSKVANILGTPGEVKYTNKERIQKEYESAVQELKKIENPKETASALKTLATTIQTALDSQTARKAGAITITLPVGLAQLAFKALMLFLAAMTFLFIDVPSFGQIPVSTTFLPNRGFNTTKAVYNQAKKATGVNNANKASNWF
jgi:hypothetical protein